MYSKSVFTQMLLNLEVINTTLSVIATSINDITTKLEDVPTTEEFEAINKRLKEQEVELQKILESLKPKKKPPKIKE